MGIRSKATTVLAAAGLLLGAGLVSAGNAGAASGWYDFGPGTGIHSVDYNGYTSDFSRAGSGIVEQWIAPGVAGVGTHGAYYLYKPLTTTGFAPTPFKPSCDSLGRTGAPTFPRTWTYYDPAITTDYFVAGMTYYTCQYDLSNWATGDVTYTVYSATLRHVKFDVQTEAPGVPAHGWMTYSDADGISYSVDVTAVHISGDTVTFSGFYPEGSTSSWLVIQATNNGGALSLGGSVVSSDPSGSLGTFTPTDIGVGVAGSINIYTR